MIWVEDSEGYNISHSVYLMILNMMCCIFALSGKSNHYFNLSAIINNAEKIFIKHRDYELTPLSWQEVDFEKIEG